MLFYQKTCTWTGEIVRLERCTAEFLWYGRPSSNARQIVEQRERTSGLDRIRSKLHEQAVAAHAKHHPADANVTGVPRAKADSGGDDSGWMSSSKAFWLGVLGLLFVWQIAFIGAYLKSTKQYNWEKYTERTRLQLDKDGNPQQILDEQGNLEWQCLGFRDHIKSCDRQNCDCKWKVPGRWVPVVEGSNYDEFTIPGQWVADDDTKTQYTFVSETELPEHSCLKQPCDWVPDPQRTMWRDLSELREEAELKNIPMPTKADQFLLGVTSLDTAWIRACFSCCGKFQNRPCGCCRKPEWWENKPTAIMWLVLGTNPLVFLLVATIEALYFLQCGVYNVGFMYTPLVCEGGYRDPGPRTHFPLAYAEQVTLSTGGEHSRAFQGISNAKFEADVEVLKPQMRATVAEYNAARLKEILIEGTADLKGVDHENLCSGKDSVQTKKGLSLDGRKGEQAPDGLGTPSEDGTRQSSLGFPPEDQHHIEVRDTFQQTAPPPTPEAESLKATRNLLKSLWDPEGEVEQEDTLLLLDENGTINEGDALAQ